MFEWDGDNEGHHIARHQVDRYEAEEAAEDPAATIRRIGKDRFGNPEYVYVGKTEDGRVLFMIISLKGLDLFRVGSARDATFQEKRGYRRRNKGRSRE